MAKLSGNGSITEITKGKKYRISLSCGKDPITGKYMRVQETFLGTRLQAQRRIDEIREELKQGKQPNADKVRFSEWCEEYLKMRRESGNYRTKTLQQERTISKHLLRGLGDAKVVEITPKTVSDLMASMREAGVGVVTIRQCYGLLKRIMRYALINRLILTNPVELVDPPKKTKPKRRALSINEVRQLEDALTAGTPSAWSAAAYTALHTGARLGEVLGLEWRHVYMGGSRPYIHIIQQHTPENTRTALKTDSDDNPVGRDVPLDASTVEVLAAWRVEQQEQLSVFGLAQDAGTPVFTSSTGGWIDHAHLQRWWRSFCVDAGLGRWVDPDGHEVVELRLGDDASAYEGCIVEWRDGEGWPCDADGRRYSRTHKRPEVRRHYDGLTFHELRHTYFTLLLHSGVDIPTAQALGGWSTPEMLNRVYSHPTPEHIWSTVGFMDRLHDADAQIAAFESGFAHDLLKNEQERQPARKELA